jgi:DNA-binding transcriptional regulator YiaG
LSNREINEKPSVAARIIRGLQEITEVLESSEDITKHFACRTCMLDLKPKPFGPRAVKKVRKLLGASQATLAQLLGVSVKTVRAWEQGSHTPSDMACRFLDEIRRDPPYWIRRLHEAVGVT